MSQNQRPPEPEIVRLWRLGEMPKCCHTCLTYDDSGNCRFYNTRPPDEFAATLNACPEWKRFFADLQDDDIPF